ncbi:hypothetical protein RB653_008002 [Dictyostelium firmibasis]|uniref:NAD-dependent epimerase/dehydratase domain-containing protein n=1 Tax=Dictyostelium firmibasis TaxID=79012 RepID=A0AAN7YWA4_9MYCE
MINNLQNKVVVTGATGYIASAIIKELLLDDDIDKVIAIVRDKSNVDKHRFLLELKNAEKKLEIESGDLQTADYDSIFNGATGILHVASPYIYKADDPQRDIVEPAIQGNLRVLEAASRHQSTIRKVIITSSTAAIIDLEKKKEQYDESDWNDSSNISNPYSYSKYLAEKATWSYKETNIDKVKSFEIIIINPAFVLGPPVEGYPSLNTSLTTFRNSLMGIGEKVVTNRFVGLIDIRDVVKAHIKALKSSENFDHQRYLMANTVVSFAAMGELVKQLFPQYDINPTPTDPSVQVHPHKLTSISPLKLSDPYIDINTTLSDCVNYLINSNNFNPKPKQ